MNYYKRHLGDYAAATRHLSMIEHGAYTLLLDLYYITEKPLPADEKAVFRLVAARSKEEREAVAQVLSEFFDLREDGWHQNRCDEELATKQEKAAKNREIGKRGGRPRKTQTVSENETQTVNSENPNGYQTETQTVSENNPSHKPIANSHKPEEETTTTPPPESREEPPPSSSPPPEKIPDEASSRAVQLAVILRRGGACPNTHAGSKGMQELVDLHATNAEALAALETAKRQRQAAGSAQAITVAYLVPIVRELRATPPDKPKTAAQRRSAWSAEMANVIAQADPRQPREIDMGVIDATDIDH